MWVNECGIHVNPHRLCLRKPEEGVSLPLLTRIASQKVLAILLYLSPQHWVYGHVHGYAQLFMWVLWIESRCSCVLVNALSN